MTGPTFLPRPAAALPERAQGAARVLHTSDWHLGCSVRNHPRAADHDAVLDELAAVAAAARPDLVVHTGDLFDGHRPPMADFGRAIRALRALAEVAPVVVLAGNHDSAVTMEVLGTALGDDLAADLAAGTYDPHRHCRHRVRIHHRPTLPERGAVATYPSAAGVDIRLAALPFVHANRVLTDFAQLARPNATYADNLRKLIDTISAVALAGFDPARHVALFASHLHVTGAHTSTERPIHISEDYAADVAHLPAGYAYLAFGHIHVPQVVAGGRGRYAGSILEVNFGEEGEAKEVVLVDLEPGRPARQHPVPLTAGRRLRRVRRPLAALPGLADEIGTAMVEVTVTAGPTDTGDDGPAVGDDAHDSLAAAVSAALPDATIVSVVDARRAAVVTADELELPVGATGSVHDAYRSWLRGEGAAVVAKHPDVEPRRIVELFDELLGAAASGDTVEPAEAITLASLGVEV